MRNYHVEFGRLIRLREGQCPLQRSVATRLLNDGRNLLDARITRLTEVKTYRIRTTIVRDLEISQCATR